MKNYRKTILSASRQRKQILPYKGKKKKKLLAKIILNTMEKYQDNFAGVKGVEFHRCSFLWHWYRNISLSVSV